MLSADRYAVTKVFDGIDPQRQVRVSTVFLGLDLRNTDDVVGPPLLWETRVFGGAHNGLMQRYASMEGATAGHNAICRRVARTIQ